MNLAKGPARLGFAVALLALLMGPLLFSAGSALAQGAPANFYGGGLDAGSVVTASIGDAECGSATVDDSGGWAIQIAPGAACSPLDGATVGFAVDGAAANETATWSPGALPADVANGISLTLADGMGDDGDGMGNGDGMGENGDGMGDGDAPEPGEPGQAGLVTSTTGSSLAGAGARHPRGCRHRRCARLDAPRELTFGPRGGPPSGRPRQRS